MAFVIHYSTPSEVQLGPIEVVINFTNDTDNTALYVNPGGNNPVTRDNFELVDLENNLIDKSKYSLEVFHLATLDYRKIVITVFEGSGSFRIRTTESTRIFGYPTTYSTSSSGAISSGDEQIFSGIITYDITPSGSVATPPTDLSIPGSEPTSDPGSDPEFEPEPNTGPEQSQFITSISSSGSLPESLPLEEPSSPSPELSVYISRYPAEDLITYHKSLETVIADEETGTAIQLYNEIVVFFTWYVDNVPIPVFWGGPRIDRLTEISRINNTIEVEIGSPPRYYDISPKEIASSIFTQRIQLAVQSRGILRLEITVNSAVAKRELISGEATDRPQDELIIGPSEPIEYFIAYDLTIDDSLAPSVKIITPPFSILSSPSVAIEFHWSEPMSAETFKKSDILVTGKNLKNKDITLIKGNVIPITLSADKFRMLLTFSRDEDDSDPFDESGVITIQVKARSASDRQGLRGPLEPEEISFNYDLRLAPPGTGIGSDDTTNLMSVCSESFSYKENPFLDKIEDDSESKSYAGGAFAGVSDLTFIKSTNGKSYLYGTMQIRRSIYTYNPSNLNQSLSGVSGGALFQVDLSQMTNCTKVIKAYPYFVIAARSLVKYDNQLYFYEGSHYSQIFSPTLIGITSDRETDWRHSVGRLRSFQPGNPNIDDKDPTIDYGLVWKMVGQVEFTDRSQLENLYEEEIFLTHKATSAPMRVIGNDLYLYSGTGNLNSVNDYFYLSENEQRLENLSATLDNWILLKYSNRLEYRLPVLQTNDKKGYNILNELAQITGSYIGSYGRTIFFIPKFPRKAKLISLIDSSSVIKYHKNNRQFPENGLLLIENGIEQEVIYYSKNNVEDPDETEFQGLCRGLYRGQYNTKKFEDITATTESYDIYFINYIFDMDANHFIRPINEMNYRTDFTQLYNQFKLRYSLQNPPVNEEFLEHYIENKESVDLNGGKELEIEIRELDERHESWIEWLGSFYSDFYSNLHYITNLSIIGSFHFRLGDTILLRETRLSQILSQKSRDKGIIPPYRKLQVLNISQNKKENITNLQLRTL